MVLLHGFTDTGFTWTPVLAGLETHHDVIAPTMLGHWGGPPLPAGARLSIEALVDAVERDMDSVGFQTAHLVGNSLGGWIALQLAARGRARSVVALSPAGGWVHGSREGRRILRYFHRNYVLLRAGRPFFNTVAARPRARTLALRDLVARPGNLSAAAALALIRGAAECPAYTDALRLARAEGLGDLDPVHCPVLIAWGTRDALLSCPRYSQRFHKLLPDADFVELPGLGHLPQWDDPGLVTDTILALTTRIQAAPAAA
jgi:pimeloyl-ACP methyl ester carboxylesterase